MFSPLTILFSPEYGFAKSIKFSEMPSAVPNTTSGRKSLRRPRAVQACNLCRTKKYKCDGNLPCVHCRRQCIDCVYQGAPKQHDSGHYSVAYAKKLERRLRAAEAVLLAHSLYLNDDLEACQIDADGQKCAVSTPRDQLPTAKNFNAGSIDSDHVAQSSDVTCEHGTIEGESMNNEVMDINTATKGFEYHGQTSSIAFLERLRNLTESSTPAPSTMPPIILCPKFPPISGRSLVTDFHNDSFINHEDAPAWMSESYNDDEFYAHQAYTFIEAYFSSQQYVHPVVDKEPFLCLCRKLWDGQAEAVERSFKAVYFALLALGALTRTWNEENISGKGRYEWTRLLFRKAEAALGRPGAFPNLCTIQACLILAKACQYQLDLNLAYTYLGLGIRTALTCGINRLTVFRVKDCPKDSPTLIVARTWWALYSLEIELSFALGRPDTLGLDFHHNRPVPSTNGSESDMIRATLDLSMVIRDVSSSVHLSAVKLPDRLKQAKELEQRLNNWLTQLPEEIRPTSGTDILNSGSIRDHQWAKLQMFVLNIRYLHVMTVLFHPFFQLASKTPNKSKLSPELIEAAEKCVDSAVTMISIIHDTYRMHHFMRTWWYNTVYLSFGMSVLLVYEAKKPFPSRWNYDPLLYVEQSLDALETMQECKVAMKIANFARELLDTLRKQRSGPKSVSGNESAVTTDLPDFWSGMPQFDELFPDYIGEFEGYVELSLFDQGFSSLGPVVEHSMVSPHNIAIYPSSSML